jgi:hypothetical protein
MTGEITKEQITKITVNPTSVSFDKYEATKVLTIKVDMGSIGVDKWLRLYKVTETGSTRVGSESITACNKNICTEDATLTYKLGAEVGKGTFFFRAERDNYDSAEHDIKFDSNKFIVQ